MSLLLLEKALLEKYTAPPFSLSLTHYVNVDINENNLKPKTWSMQHHPNIIWQAIGDVNLPCCP